MEVNDSQTTDYSNRNKIEKENLLEKELKEIDELFEKDLENLSDIERENTEILENLTMRINSNKINIDHNQENLIAENKLSESKKQNKIIDSKIILDSITLNPYFDNSLIQNVTEEERANILLSTKIFYLNDKKITKIANLEIYENLIELYLQRNLIKKIEGLDYLKNLKILSLNNNYINKIEGINHLSSLKILDLGDNIIESFEIENFHPSLSYLYLFDNIFYDNISLLDYRSQCVKFFSDLKRLDGLDVSDLERRILIEEEDVNEVSVLVIQKLNYIEDHYFNLRKSRNEMLKRFSGNFKSLVEEENFVTDELNSQSFNLDKIKEEINLRKEDFEKEMRIRSSTLRQRLNDIYNKSKVVSIISDERKKKIEGKINKAMKFDEKKDLAESIIRGFSQVEASNPDAFLTEKIGENFDFLNTNENWTNNADKKFMTANSFLSGKDKNKEGKLKVNENSLLSDISDLSYINKNNN